MNMSGYIESQPLGRTAATQDAGANSQAADGTQSHRLRAGGLIDRQKPLSFTFDGKAMTGYAGDTLASALVANGARSSTTARAAS
jgi:sarcosine oxidase subunit alpha